jgi:hypothetical protein
MTLDLERATLEHTISLGHKPQIERALEAYYRAAVSLRGPELDAAVAQLDHVLRVGPVELVSLVAILAGALVERGADPKAFPGTVFDLLVELLATIETPESEIELPPQFYVLEQGAMAALSRSPELRRTFPQKPTLMERIQRYSERYGFLGKMLTVIDNEPIVVLHPSSGRGFRFQMSGVADNFQLHVLLLGALAGDASDCISGIVPDPASLAASRDGDVYGEALSVASSWQLTCWPALHEDATLDGVDCTQHWIWNEGTPSEITHFDGTRVILIGPSAIQRSWNAPRVFPGMHGVLDLLGVMSADESQALLAEISRRAALLRSTVV